MPKKYNVHYVGYFYSSLTQIINHKFDVDQEQGAIKFYTQVIEITDKLENFPDSGKPMRGDYRAKIVRGCMIMYKYDDKNVYVVDIVDPTQHTVADKYYSD